MTRKPRQRRAEDVSRTGRAYERLHPAESVPHAHQANGHLDASRPRGGSHALFERLFRAFDDGLVLHEYTSDITGGHFLHANDAICQLLGYSVEEMRQLTLRDILAAAESAGAPAAVGMTAHESTPARAQVLRAKDGRHIHAEIRTCFFEYGGRRIAFSVICEGAERGQIEDRLRRLNDRLEEQVQARTEQLRDTVAQLQKARDELEHRTHQLRKLTLELSQAEDRERQRVAEFLHDELQQVLAAARFHLGLLASRVRDEEEIRVIAEQVGAMLREAIEKSRNLSHELRPVVLHQGDLSDAFRWLAGRMETTHGLTVQVQCRGPVGPCSEPMTVFLYRAAQEILFNVVKHAHVRQAKLRLRRAQGRLRLLIADKGRGFDPKSLVEPAGCGLLYIRERVELLGGRMKIRSAPGRGSVFLITVPDADPASTSGIVREPTDT